MDKMVDVFYPLNKENVTLYHYTSLESLKSIVENRTLRLGDYKYLNDVSEFEFSLKNFNSVFAEFDEEKITPIKQALNNLNNGIDFNYKIVGCNEQGQTIARLAQDTDTHFYIFSMTENEDNLSMWKMYGENGVCIKLNKKTLDTFFGEFQAQYVPFGILNIPYGKVNYDTGNEFERKVVAEIIEKQIYDTNMYDILYRMCMLRKDITFSYENEYRLGIKFFDKLLDKNRNLKKVFCIKNGTLIPQLEFQNFPVAELIESVSISPYNKSDRAVLGLKTFLKAYLNRDIDVAPSQIKIR